MQPMKPYLILFFLLGSAACQPETPESPEGRAASAAGAYAYFLAPQNGDTLAAGPVKVVFGLSGMGVAPSTVDFPNSGHHHLLVNANQLPPMDQPIPADSVHIHYGLGQTEATVDLAAGTYTLQILLGDQAHVPHDPPVLSDPITITVQ